MERLLTFVMHSKMAQKYAIYAGAIFVVIFLLPGQYRTVGRIVIVIALGLLLIYNLLVKGIGKGFKKKKANTFEKGLEKEVKESKKGKVSNRKAQSELSKRWDQAITQLKKAGMDMYTLPWYLLIGEPQSGKSTTLKNSQLEFPVGTEALSGAGGTRNCDWWFTNDAVVLDTAGRFTFQEKEAPDSGEWKSFLGMLRKNRAACPINGVLLVIPCSSLLGDTDEQREEKAVNIREKLQELQRELSIQFPVYVLITKGDQILGFTEFFSKLPAEEQCQILGWSMEGPFIQSYDPDKFYGAFDSVSERIHRLRLKLLGEDIGLSEIDKLYVFPEEFRAIRGPLHDYLKAIFVKNAFLPELFFRGYYFTSGMQVGKPFAKACAAILRTTEGAADQLVEDLAGVFAKSKAFFIRDFYRDKLFQEKNLVVRSVKKLSLNRRLGIAAMIASGVILVLTSIFMVVSVARIRGGLDDLNSHAEKIKDEFVDTANLNKEFLDGPRDSRAVADRTADDEWVADSLGYAGKLTRLAGGTAAESLNLEKVLRDMHWMYFLQNVVQEQTWIMYAKMWDADKRGQSVKDGPMAETYAGYVQLWSLNHEWVAFTTQEGRGSFGERDRLERLGDMELTRWGGGDEEKYEKELARTVDQLGERLDFSDKPGKMYPPVKIDLVPGPFEPLDNAPIIEEIREFTRMKQGEIPPPPTEGAISSISEAEAIFLREIPGLPRPPECGSDLSDVARFGASLEHASAIVTAYEMIGRILGKETEALDNQIIPGLDKILDLYNALDWTFEAPRGSVIDTRIEEIIYEEAMKLKGLQDKRSDMAKEDIGRLEAFYNDGQKKIIYAGARSLLVGLGHYESLVGKRGELVDAHAKKRVRTTKAVADAKKEWTTSDEVGRASGWAGVILAQSEAATEAGGDAAGAGWRLPMLAETIRRTIVLAGEDIESRLWVRWADSVGPGAILTSAAYSLTDPPDDATYRGLSEANGRIAGLISELNDAKGRLDCPSSRGRLESAVGDLAAIRRTNNSNFQKYWLTAFTDWEPDEWISGIDSWEDFHGSEVMEEGVLSKRVENHLEKLVANVGEYKADGGDIGDALEDILEEVEPYLDSDDALFDRSDDFSITVVKHLAPPDEDIKLYEMGLNDNANIDNIRRLDMLPESPLMNRKLKPYPDKVLSLIANPSDRFEAKLAAFLNYWWGEGVPGKFPLDRPGESSDTEFESKEGDMPIVRRVVAIDQVDTETFVNFYLNAEFGFDAFMDADDSLINYYNSTWSQEDGHESVGVFLNRLAGLRGYFLDDDNDFTAVTVSPRYEGEELDNYRRGQYSGWNEWASGAAFYYGEDFLGDLERRTVAKPLTEIEFVPGSLEEGQSFRVIVSLLFNSQGNVDVTTECRVIIPNDFSVLAYLHEKSGDDDGRQRWSSVLFDVTPRVEPLVELKARAKSERGVEWNDAFGLEIEFDLDRALPELPDWNSVADWR